MSEEMQMLMQGLILFTINGQNSFCPDVLVYWCEERYIL